MQLPNGYYWGPKLTKPTQLSIGLIETFPVLNGLYDIVTIPVGDNWAILNPDLCQQVSINIINSNISIKPRFSFDEPSCGFVIGIRKHTEQNSEPWELVAPQDGGAAFGYVSVPIYTHVGSRIKRYSKNGYMIAPHKIGFPNTFQGIPKGPLSFSKEEIPLSGANYPDISIVCALSGTFYVACSKVDMFGRESALSDPVQVTVPTGSRVFMRRNFVPEMGTCGIYIYIGTSPDNLHRQPVLDRIGKTKYLWPVWIEQYVLNNFMETHVRHVIPPDYGVASILNWPQKQIADGKSIIKFERSSYDLYCPFLLPYDPLNFDRQIGGDRKCTFTHKVWYGQAKLVEDIPLCYIQNQNDTIKSAKFVSNHAPVGVTFSDYSGGQAFSNILDDCEFELYGEDAVGFLVDDLSSKWVGEHTTSEIRSYKTNYLATVPVLIEGNQSCQINFDDMCGFWAYGNTRYLGDTAIIYAATPNDVDIKSPEGIGGTYRAIVCLCCDSGQPHVTLDDVFLDGGCNVYVVSSDVSGGKVTIKNGDTINSHSQSWAKLIEAPISYQTKLQILDVKINHNCTAISYMLNQLAINLDFPVQAVIMPSQELWISKNLPLQMGHVDFTKKPILDYHVGYEDMPDTLVRKSNVEIAPPLPT